MSRPGGRPTVGKRSDATVQSLMAIPTYHDFLEVCRVTNKGIDPTDGLPASVVGPWAAEKHERLRKYIDAYRAARAKFLPPRGEGGAAYIELYSGAGRSQIEG